MPMPGHTSYPLTLHGMFEEETREAPNQIAIEHEGECLTYGDLNRRANKLAHYLRDTSGVRPDDRVAVIVRHPISFITAIIATLKAGGAYIAIDTDSPFYVIQQMLADARPTALVLESGMAANAEFFDGDIFLIDVMAETVQAPDFNPGPLAGPSNLAYVMYTSGTTGTPKGVAIEHRSIVNTITWRSKYYGFGSGDATLNMPKPSFDSSVEDIFCALTSGCRLVLPERARITEPEYVAELIEDRRVTNFLITPSLHRRILRALGTRPMSTLRIVTVAGEWFPPDLIREHYRCLPHVKLYNEYGPAENAVCSTVHPLSISDDTVLIGKPIDNVAAFAIDEDGVQVGPGEIGELCLAGAGLARCYLGNQKLTDEKFNLRRSSGGTSMRVYRTGDMVRVYGDGNFQFTGRRDRQIKIRGQRVELDHIAQCFTANDLVDDVFVLGHHSESSGLSRIMAFVVGPEPADITRVEAAAREQLPAHMVPSVIIPVASIPLTSHGKVDEHALLAWATSMDKPSNVNDGELTTPPSGLEESLLLLWRETLERHDIGLDDDFFTVGGDSLALMDLVSGVRDLLNVQVAVATIYENLTIRALAQYLTKYLNLNGSD